MSKLKMHGMQCHAVNQRFFGFLAVIFSVTDQRMPHGVELARESGSADLSPVQRSGGSRRKGAFNGIAQLGAVQPPDLSPVRTADTSLLAEIMH